MINLNENLILIKGEIKTCEIDSIQYQSAGKYSVTFKNSIKEYVYSARDIVWLKNPTPLNPNDYKIRHNGYVCENIRTLSMFSHYFNIYYHIEYESGSVADYRSSEIEIIESCLNEEKSKEVFEYFKDVAKVNSLKSDEGVQLLSRLYEGIDFIPSNMVIAPYLYPQKYKVAKRHYNHLIFPFGCNNSQIKAVKAAFDSQLSIIQGPPGTGKTQTILNIIANILIHNQTVLVVSNNNSAIENIYEKLQKYELDFIVANLGRSENKTQFVESQQGGRKFPDTMVEWEYSPTRNRDFRNEIDESVKKLQELFGRQERLALLRQELSAIEIEWEHFRKDVREDNIVETNITSKIALKLLIESQESYTSKDISLLNRIKLWVKRMINRYYYKIDKSLLNSEDDPDVTSRLQTLFYQKKIAEIKDEIDRLEFELEHSDIKELMKSLGENSIRLLKDCLFQKFTKEKKAFFVTKESLYSDAKKVLEEFPVVLSTTFSARSSLHNAEYDYLIMDEASQVSVETGVLALSCVRNAVIVGDTMQLPNVVTSIDKKKLEDIANQYNIPEGYHCEKNSFLQSVINILPYVPQTLLREHYRCVPDIINFCNQKFYSGQLVIMTKENEETESIFAVKTAKGFHCHDHVNLREIEVISQEILPKLSFSKNEIGIIAPYNNQVEQIKSVVDPEIDVATVHKFQGREKDAIIMGVTDDLISDFADDPNLLNVAVSRAKKLFCLVVSGNNQTSGNIVDLMGYIEYHHGRVIESRIHSIYDMLYKENEKVRADYLKNQKRISEYDSENLTHVLIQDVLSSNQSYASLDVLCHYPLSLLIADFEPLSEEEKRYASNRLTHLDFLIYNRVSKIPVLAIEVDGWTFHQEGSEQSKRDKMKDHILPIYGISILRLSTTGSNEKEKIENVLDSFIHQR